MIDQVMFAALGFFVASLFWLLLAPPLWKRAVRLTSRRLEATLPMTLSEIQADKDQLRAEFAVELRRIEVALQKAKDKAARELVEANKRRVRVAELEGEIAAVQATLQENANANRVLEQTVRRRLPDLETRLKKTKETSASLDTINAELRDTLASQSETLKRTRGSAREQRREIDQLRSALEAGTGGLRNIGMTEAKLIKEQQRLIAELSRTKEELQLYKSEGAEDELLRQELGKLANQILDAARSDGEAPPPMAHDEAGRLADWRAAPHANGQSNGAASQGEPRRRRSVENEADIAKSRAQESMSQARLERVSSGRRLGGEGATMSGSLNERLKDATAEAPES